jgi:PAT family beta-lactamase induction signal transducer AmpG
MREAGSSLTTIAFFSWVSMIYGVKILWAPFLERLHIPFLTKALGQTRALMILSQIGIFIGLILMGLVGPTPQSNLLGNLSLSSISHLTLFASIVAFVVFSAATLGIAIDSWRVQMTDSEADEALHPTFFAFGSRIGILLTDSLILFLAKRLGWPLSIEIIACSIIIGMAAVIIAPKFLPKIASKSSQNFTASLMQPFTQFTQKYAKATLLLMVIVGLYRLPDYLIGPIVTPMYQDTGLDYDVIASMRATIGLGASLCGIAIGGICLLYFGLFRTILLGALAGPASNLCFAWMSYAHADPGVFGISLIIDNVSNGVAGAAAVALMTRLVDKDFAITQFSLLMSIEAFTGKFLKGFMGYIIDYTTNIYGLFNAYAMFFTTTALMSLPVILLCWIAGKRGYFEVKPFS